jgi:uncharacterized repeat protein (TIGR01451 family)
MFAATVIFLLLPVGNAEVKPPSAASTVVPAAAMPSQDEPGPISSQAVAFAESRPLRDVARQKAPVSAESEREREEAEEHEAAENPTTRVVSPQARIDADEAAARGIIRDTALQTMAPALSMPTPLTSFEGLGRSENIAAGFGSLSPPDTNGDVGPNHYVQQDNLLVRVWDKTGTPLVAPFKLSTLFTPLGGTCAASDKGDPIVLYDQLADRWMLSQFGYVSDTAPPFFQCIAISKTSDPTGAYYLYAFQTPGADFPDYPHLGVWPDGYYMMDHQFTEPGDIYNGVGVFSFDRVKMLAGDPTATYIYFSLGLASHPEAIGGMMPSDLDGITPPPLGRPNTFAYFTTTDFSDPANGIRLFDFHADFATPANSTFTERAESSYAAPVAVAPFSVVNPATSFTRAAIPQPAPATASAGLDTIADRIMFRMQYRNRGGFETLVFTHTVGAPASTTFGTYRAAPRYYELRSTAGGPFAVQEQATFAPADGVSRWMGSAAEDNQGNLALGYSASSTSVFPSIRYAGRLATDPPNGLAQGEAELIAGTGVQTSTGSRWGDYSALTVDPSDDCTFWYTTEYYTAAGQAASAVGWQTRIGSFKFPTCTAPARGTAHFTVTNCASAANIQNAVVTVDGITYGVTATDGTYNAPLAPGAHTYSVTKAGASIASGNFSITNGNTTNVGACIASGTAHFVVTDCTSAAAVAGASVSVDGNPVGTTNAGGTLDVAMAPGSHNYSITKAGYATTSNSFNITDGATTNVNACLTGVPLMVANGASVTVDANNNGAIDPGELVTVSFGVKNNGAGATTSLVGTLQATGGVTSPGSPANYGVVAANGGTAAQPISFTASNSLTCGSTITASLQLQDGANNLGTVTYNFTVCPIVIVTATAATTGPSAYASVKAAFDAINAGTHQGAVTVSINSSTTEGATPATLNGSGAGAASYTSVLIRPVNDGVSVSGNPAGGLGVIQLNGASNVTIDGDNPNTGGTNRNLTISNTASNTTTFNSVIRIALATTGATAANNDTIKNLIVLGSATGRNISGASSTTGSENTTYGILASSGSTGVTAAPAAVTSVSSTIGSPATASNLLIQNNSVTTAGRAISTQGAATTVFSGLQIKDNVVGNATAAATSQVYASAILVNGTANGIVSGNTLYLEGFLASSTSGANQAISVGVLSTNTSGVTVEKNRVARVRNNATDTWPAVGINLGGGNNHIVQNNFVYDIMNNMVAGAGGGGTTFGAYGIRVASGTGHKVYHNSVHLFGVLPGATSTNLTTAFIIVNTSQTGMDVRNNLFSNEQTGGNPTTTNVRHAVIYLPSGATSAMNLTLNNNAYLQGPAASGALSLLAKVGTAAGTGQFFAADFNAGATTPATNLRSYTSTLSAAGTNDNASIGLALAPPFTSNTDLHIPNGTTSPLESGGAAVGVTTDIDNQTRPGPPGSVNGGGTAPDIGADEFDGIVGAFATPTPTPPPSPTPTPTPGPCSPFSEGFDNVAALTTSGGWVNINNSTTTGTFTWGQGNPAVFPAQAGASTDSYASVNFQSTTGTNDISNWLIMPTMTLRDGNTLSFWTRTTDVGANLFPDRLQVRMSLNGTSTNVGATAASVGDFTNLLLDINPTYVDAYPHVWTKYTITLSGIGAPTVGRLAFRYFVEGGGPDAARSDYIGIDSLEFGCLQDQTITFNPLPDKNYGDPDFQVSATASSGLPVSFTTSGNCTNTGDMVHLTGAGSCTVTAHQPGNASFNAAPDVGRTFNILSAVLNISMTADRNPALVEYNHNYKPVITNTGNAPATNVILTDVLPSIVTLTATSTSQGTCSYVLATKTVTCNLGTINPGGTVNVQITVKPRSEGTLNNTATITAGQWDPTTGNSSASVNGLPAIKIVDLALSKFDSADPIYVSQNTTYTLIVKNFNTPVSATGVVVTDNLPASMTFVSATTSQGSLITPPVGSTGIVTANVGTLAVNATATITITVKANSAGTITNTASASSTETENDPSNNSASQSTTVLAATLQKVLLAKQVLIGGCENSTGNVYLVGTAPAGGLTVNLSTTSLAGVTVPASVFIPAGQSVSPAFNVTTSPVATKQVGLVNATLGASTVSRNLTINVGSGSCPP